MAVLLACCLVILLGAFWGDSPQTAVDKGKGTREAV